VDRQARDASRGDLAYLRGDFVGAAAAYRADVARDPSSDEPWVGLAAALRRAGEEPSAAVLTRRPDLVRALYLDGIATRPSTPDEVAAWLAEGGDDSTVTWRT
jgi:hypothetical protein